jgi:DedD protein
MEKQKVVKKIKKIIKQKPKPIIVVKPKFKPKPKPKPQPKPIEKNTSKAIGSFVQIGAFTKAPDKKLIAKIKSKGYSYIVHKMVIKGRTYNKVLVGPFTNGQPLKNALTKVRKDLNVPKAYILRLKYYALL